jgi:uncharacterized protein YjbJ (UPF0337 family)
VQSNPAILRPSGGSIGWFNRSRSGTAIAESTNGQRAASSGAPRRLFLLEKAMNWDRIEGNWKQFKGTVKQQWGKLTDDQIDEIEGSRDRLAGKIQESYGIGRDEADRQVKDWEDKL